MKHRVEYNYDQNCFHIATHNAPLALSGDWSTVSVFKDIDTAVSFVDMASSNLENIKFNTKSDAMDHYRRLSYFVKDFWRMND